MINCMVPGRRVSGVIHSRGCGDRELTYVHVPPRFRGRLLDVARDVAKLHATASGRRLVTERATMAFLARRAFDVP